MAIYFWVGGSGTWDSTTTTHWASTSGGAGGAGVPVAADTANFDFNSGTTATVTLTNTAVASVVNVDKADITLTLSGNVAFGGIFTFTSGAINLAGFSLATNGGFVSSNSNARSIAFGTGNITFTISSSITPLSMATATNFTWTGTGGFVSTQVAGPSGFYFFGGTAGGSATNAPNLTITGVVSSSSASLNGFFKNVSFTNVFGVGSYSACGNLSLATVGSTALSPTFITSGTLSCGGTSGIQILTINGTGITVTLNGNAIAQLTILTAGTLNLANFNLSTLRFNGSGTATRAIAFGTGNITLTSTVAAALVLSMGDATNFTWTGTGGFLRNQAATAQVAFGTIGGTTTNAVNLTLTSGGSELTVSTGSYFKNVNFSSSSCRVTNGFNVCGNLSLHPSGIYTFSPTFLTSGTLTTSSNSLGGLIVSGAGITVTLADALTTSGAVTLTDGTLKLKSAVTSTVGSFVTTGTTLKYLTSPISGTQATLSDTTGTNTVTYLSIKDIAATGGAVWDALDSTNVDAGNNSGWGFPVPPVIVTGVSATGVIGTVTTANGITVTGVFATGTIGNVIVPSPVVVTVTGVSATGVIGDVLTTQGFVVYPTGVVAYGLIGPVNVWGLVIDAQTPNWGSITNTQTPIWATVPTLQTPNWQSIIN